jgi:hypothetical protein
VPFTASHPAAVLPFVRRGRWVTAGLVAGSVAPDLPSFVPVGLGHDQTHPLGAILWPDGLLAIGVLLAWWVLLRPGLAPLWPAAAARCGPSGWRSAPQRDWRRRVGWVGWLAGSLLLGLATHLLWDSGTHADGFLVRRWSPLSGWWAGHHVFDWLQALSSVVGLAVVVGCLVRSWRRSPQPAPADPPLTGLVRAAVLVVMALLVLLAAGLEWHALSARHAGHLLLWSDTTKAGGAALVAALGTWSLVWVARTSWVTWSAARRPAADPHSRTTAGVP